MELNTTFAMFNAKERTYNDKSMSYNYAHKLALYRKDIGYCNPLLDAHAIKLSVCSLARTGGNSLSCLLFNSNSKMPKNIGIKGSAKHSTTTFTSCHETAHPNLSKRLSKMLYFASKLANEADVYHEQLKRFNGFYERDEDIMRELSDLGHNAICLIGEAIGQDFIHQAFTEKYYK